MHCSTCNKKGYGNARDAMVALARAVSLRIVGDSRREIRFYPCPHSGSFHLTSEASPSWDKGTYARLSAMVVANADKVLSRA